MPSIAQYLPDNASISADNAISLDLHVCPYCGVAFLDSDPVEYYREVIRAVDVSAEIKNAKYKQFNEFCNKYNLIGKDIIEIGCGNGEFLSILDKCGVNAFGIEYSADSVAKCSSKGFNVYQGFITDEDYRICEKRFDGFLLLMFLEHIPKPRDFLKGVHGNLKDDAFGIIEVPDSDMIFTTGLYAEVMKDHLYYFNLNSLSTLLNSCGFEIVEENTIREGYVLSVTVKKRKILDLNNIGNYLERVREHFQNVLCRYNKVIMWGASHQTFFLLSQIGDMKKICQIIDSTEFKQGKYSPVSHIPICKPSEDVKNADAIIVSAGSYSPEIVEILHKDYNYSGDIYVFAIDSLRKQEIS